MILRAVALLLLLLSGAMAPARATVAATVNDGGRILVLLRLPPPHLRPGADYGGGYGDGASQSARRRIALKLARAHGLTMIEDWPMPLLGVDCFVMAVPAGRSVAAMAAVLSTAAGVAWSQPLGSFAGQQARPAALGDPLFRAQPAASQWHLADLHAIADGRGERVAVIDSQVERTHPDLIGQVEFAADFGVAVAGGESHGTAVAAIIAARAGNGIGIAGVAPRARILALRACWQRRGGGGDSTVCDSLSLAKAIHRAIERGAGIINLSLGGPVDRLLAGLIDVALERGIVVVAAFDRNAVGGGFPASHPGVVAVAAAAPGPLPPGVWLAPGKGIPTARPGGGWHLVDGSSYAAAHVSGLFALLRGQLPRGRDRPQLVGGGGVIDSCATLLRRVSGRRCPAAQVSAGLGD